MAIDQTLKLTVEFYKTQSNPTMIEKNLGRVLVSTSCYPYNDFNVINPTFILAYESDVDYRSFNYFRINQWDRYYFITGLSYDSGKVLLAGSEDVLMTYKDAILAQTQVMARVEDREKANFFLPDNEVYPYCYSFTNTIDFPNGFDETWCYGDGILIQAT